MSFHDSTLLASDGGAYILDALEEFLIERWKEEEASESRREGFDEGQSAIAWIVKRLGPELKYVALGGGVGIVDRIVDKAKKYVEENEGDGWDEIIQVSVVEPLEDIKDMRKKGLRWDHGIEYTNEAPYKGDGIKWF